ncbi:molybdopterin-dependent oxidoreductase [Psychromicrobium lacuslunae]|uniref:Oxidoreductase n=1 Tax=Psychromicrobium lacuslunae TaxID=1618207 RepID=A0A0D4BW80_9MICC|nr:molybdopterin-dependent oxidoreductase [Psychromicrobium lacuslunae]AJT40563.1 oxidoreductase [Psychromicrobium lacuslunae]
MNKQSKPALLWAALCGVLAVGFGLLAAELVAGFLSPSLSAVTAVGGTVIDVVPPGVKDWAIASFGTSDKFFFLIGMALVIAILAALAGILELKRKSWGLVAVGIFGLLGLLAVLARSAGSLAGNGVLVLVSPLLAAALSIVLLRVLINRLRGWRAVAGSLQNLDEASRTQPAGQERRLFLRNIGLSAAATALTALVTAAIRGSQAAYQAAREKLKLPMAQQAAAPISANAQLALNGITSLVTPNKQFYRIDTALAVPVINPNDWQLKVTGLVDREISMNLAELLNQPMQERYVTIACVSNEVGGDLIGNARWLGWPVREILAKAGVKPGADMVLSRSSDGFTASTPLQAMTDQRDAMIAVGMNGELLPAEHGFPARLIVPGLYGFVSATKWLTELKVTTFAADVAYWSTRGWSDHGPIKQSSRIDLPRSGSAVPAGPTVLGGMAWAQQRGVSKVELSVDGGDWQPVKLASAISKDTWVQWQAELMLDRGEHQVRVRCVDGLGEVQSSEVAPPAPDGSSGYHQITLRVG